MKGNWFIEWRIEELQFHKRWKKFHNFTEIPNLL